MARDFVDAGWDVKRLCRQIVLSSTYRQNSACSSELRQKDPDNQLLARGPSRRLSAEMIRDTALAASELLNGKRGGPPVGPYQPPGLWREANSMSPAYEESVGRELYRRSLYTVWKRTAPPPNMLAFDAVSREVCRVRRLTTNTPIQALVLLNDVQFVECARALAERVLREDPDDDAQRVRRGFRLLTARRPRDAELKLLLEVYAEQRALYGGDPAQAHRLIALGESPAATEVDAAELAAATVVMQTVLNLDATIWLR